MNNLLCKSILIISIITSIIALITPNWGTETVTLLGVSETGTSGLFSQCLQNASGKMVCQRGNADNNTKTARVFIIMSILLLGLGLGASIMLDNNPKSEILNIVCMGSYVLGIILISIGIIMFMKTKPDSTTHVNFSYGYSFYLAIISVILAISAGVCKIIHKK